MEPRGGIRNGKELEDILRIRLIHACILAQNLLQIIAVQLVVPLALGAFFVADQLRVH